MGRKRGSWGKTIYVPEDKETMVLKAQDITHREGRSLSQLFIEFCEKYVREHEPGNPQTRIDKILKWGAPLTDKPKCAFCGEPATTRISIVRDMKHYDEVFTCLLHKHLARPKPGFSWSEKPL